MLGAPLRAVDGLQGQPEIEIPLPGEDVQGTILAAARQVRVCDLFRQNGDDRVPTDVGAPPDDLAARVEHDTQATASRRANQGSLGQVWSV
jgi:hypothetical protein